MFQWLFQCLCPGSEFLTGMTCSYFLGCKQGINKWHPLKTWSGGVRCGFGTQCPALLLPPLCCVHGETPPGCCMASGLPIPADYLWDCPLGGPAGPPRAPDLWNHEPSPDPHRTNEGRDQHSHTRMCLRDELLWNTPQSHGAKSPNGALSLCLPGCLALPWEGQWEHNLAFFLVKLSRRPLGGNRNL